MGKRDDAKKEAYQKAKEQVNDLLSARFRPAEDPSKATDMLTSAAIFAMIDEHSPDLVPRRDLRQILLDLNYREHSIGSDFVWLLQAR